MFLYRAKVTSTVVYEEYGTRLLNVGL